MNNLNLNKLKFNFVQPKKQKVKKVYKNKLVYCVCVEEEPDVFKAYTTITSEKENFDTRVLSFTENSYNLKGKEIVFTKTKDKFNRRTCVYRSKEQSIHFPGVDTQYTPFNNNYVYTGYIIKIDNNYYFDVYELIGSLKEYMYLVDNIELPNNIE